MLVIRLWILLITAAMVIIRMRLTSPCTTNNRTMSLSLVSSKFYFFLGISRTAQRKMWVLYILWSNKDLGHKKAIKIEWNEPEMTRQSLFLGRCVIRWIWVGKVETNRRLFQGRCPFKVLPHRFSQSYRTPHTYNNFIFIKTFRNVENIFF